MIRHLTLAEWFLKFQLSYIDKNYNHLNAFVEIDISKIIDHFEHTKTKIPMTSILIKACGLWQEQCPDINKQIFKTIFGYKLYQCDNYAVNVPTLLNSTTDPYMSVTCISNANEKNISEIKSDLKKHLGKDPRSLPIGKYLIGKSNNILNRSRLRIIHFIVNTFPSIQNRMKVATICVSSLLNLDHENTNSTFIAKGPGSMSICVCGFSKDKKIMRLGIAWDHATGNGYEGVRASQELTKILQGDNDEQFKRLLK
jgi:hypothetical protein